MKKLGMLLSISSMLVFLGACGDQPPADEEEDIPGDLEENE
ncbi:MULTISPECIES: hypothetical protein [Bacillaceae]|nr:MULTISPECIES: hypothetical protein [Bacillaceae]